MYARVVAGFLCPRNAVVLLISLPLASRNRLAADFLKACVLMRSRCANHARRAAIFITNHACCLDMPLLPPSLVYLRDSNTYRFRPFRPVLVFAKRPITGGKARFAPALRNTARSSGARRAFGGISPRNRLPSAQQHRSRCPSGRAGAFGICRPPLSRLLSTVTTSRIQPSASSTSARVHDRSSDIR
jgi:hypothetical protein